MAITRAQQFRQMLEDGGRGISLQEAKDMAPKGEFLAYINKKEAKMLKDAGGSGIMTNAGIPSYRFGDERDDAGFDSGRNADNFGGGNKGGPPGGGDKGMTYSAPPPGKPKSEPKGRDPMAQFKGLPPGYKTSKTAKAALEAQRAGFKESFGERGGGGSFLEKIFSINPTRKVLYNMFGNNPKTELSYIADLKFRNPAAYNSLPQNLKDLFEETEEDFGDTDTRSYKDFDKFSFDDFEDLTGFDPGVTGAMNFADYAATYAGAPGLKYSGNVGNLEKFVSGKDQFGRTTYGYREKTGNDNGQQGIVTQYVPPALVPTQPEPEDGNDDDDDFEFYRRFRADGGRAEYKQGSPKVDPRMKNTLAQNVANNNAQAAANAIQQAINTQTLTSPSSQMTTPPSIPSSGTGGFTVSTPTGPATFSSPGNFGSQGVMIDGKIYYSEQDAINDLGIVRYNQLMADGGRAGFAEGGMPYEGGIMDLESARQMYGLGKLVKKVTRSVKKIAKSPIGKAALLYTGAAMAGSFGATGSLFSKGMFAPGAIKAGLFGQAMAPGFSGPGIPGLFTKLGLTKTAGSLMPTALGAIAGTSIVAGMLTPAQEEEAQRISDETGIDIEEIRANPDKYLGRRFKAEGGSIDEPVAKKTMPLLDMDGQEMDFRAEGGFVPIGRMEKADDVPARLSKNEFVFTADAVRNAGDGNVDKGAEVMYNMMKNLESGGDVSEESQGLEGARNMFQTSKRLEEVL